MWQTRRGAPAVTAKRRGVALWRDKKAGPGAGDIAEMQVTLLRPK